MMEKRYVCLMGTGHSWERGYGTVETWRHRDGVGIMALTSYVEKCGRCEDRRQVTQTGEIDLWEWCHNKRLRWAEGVAPDRKVEAVPEGYEDTEERVRVGGVDIGTMRLGDVL